MKKNPILVLTGLAVAAAAGIAGLTRDQWMAPAPQALSGAETAPAPEAAAPATEQPVAAAEQEAPRTEEPAAPVAKSTTAPPATNPPAEVEAVVEAPAVETPAVQAAAPAAEVPAPVAEASAPAAETPAPVAEAPAPVAEAPAPVAETPVETPAETPLAVEAPAATVVTQQPPATPEPVAAAPQPAPEQQQAAVAPPPEAPAVAPAAETAVAAEAETVPTFDTVRVEKTGEAVIAGTAAAGSEVVVMLDGEAIGKTVANTDGAFVVVPDQPLPSGSGALTIEAKAEGAAAATTSEQTVAVIVPDGPTKDALVAIVSPNEPTRVLQKSEPQPEPEQQASAQPQDSGAAKTTPAATAAPKRVSLDAVDYDTAGNIVFTGRGQPGHSARIYVDNSHSGDAKVGDDGRWTFAENTGIAAGVHALRVDGVDGSGKVVNRVEVPFFREETNKVAAAAPGEPQGKTDQQQPPAAASPQIGNVDGRVVIQPGNNLWRISKVLYGSGAKYTLLYDANKDLIRDPDKIYPGQVFMTPDAVAPLGTVDPDLRQSLDSLEGTNGE